MQQERPKRLHRSRKEKMLAGVCGGIASYFGIDPVIVRLLWLIAAFYNGAGILVYIVAILIVPLEPEK